MQKTAFLAALEREAPLVLDGGLATQAEAQGCDIGNPLWSASLLLDNPQAIVDANRAFLDAGAECIATASYQASREGLAQRGLSADEADELMRRSVELAIRARDEYLAANPDAPLVPLVAASIGPYGAMLHDGSEYRGDYGVSAQTLRAFHAPRLRLFDASQADVLAFETVPSLPEAQVIAELLCGCATPAWVSFSCRDDRVISDDTPIEEAVGVFRDHPVVAAVGFNCTPPQYAAELIRRIRAALPDKCVMAYPNSGEMFDVSTNAWSGTSSPLDYARAARAWHAAGAKIIGGCCRTGPDHIREIRRTLT
ncbi:MAG: homocysteine S-methyltransferase [Gammaproteobacteria bacterium]|nr:homocysteine S-methyltransferase [Gammaproteobacteria bacterium]